VKFRIAALGLCSWLVGACSAGGVADEPVGDSADPIVRGHTERHYPQVVAVRIDGYNGGWTLCSGTYFDKRMVVTAAHCMRADAIPGRSYVYFGDDYNGDVTSLPEIPPPGAKSDWARVETAVVHPDYQKGLNYPDMAVLFLDRELPFDPIPLDLDHVNKRDKVGKIVGWGGSKALTPDISQVEGAGVKRSATVKILGSPTADDYHADDPNPGMLDPNIRMNLLKTDGRAPHANTCAGDSGGPLLLQDHGHDVLSGVGFWTGLSCEDYAVFTRIDPFVDYFTAESKLNGDQPVVPRLECVEEASDGKLTARFGYKNDNDLTVNVPYGPRNFFPRDFANARPSAFGPGDTPFAFKVPFGSSDKLSWVLAPKSGPVTTVVAKSSSPRCDPNDEHLLCGDTCSAQFKAECAQDGLSFGRCVSDCVDQGGFFADYFGCGTEWNAYLKCTANVPPAASNWDCSFPGFPATPVSPNCDQELTDVYVCAGFL